MNYVKFIERKIRKDRKTKEWDIYNHNGEELGQIRWSNGWRQYVFNSIEYCQFSWDCLKYISDFIKNEMEKRKKE